MPRFITMVVAIAVESFAHPLRTSRIRVQDGRVIVERTK